MWLKLTFAAIVVLGLAYVFYDPLDGPFEQPVKTQAFIALFKSIGLFCEAIGVVSSKVDCLRYGFDLPYRLIQQDDPELKIRDDVIDGVKVRIYEPQTGETGPKPAVIYFHGGGWVFGSLDTHDTGTRLIAKSLSAVVISVDYRMAPEVKFPVPFNDCFDVTKYVVENAEQFGIDGTRVVVAGDSSGGNLAAAVTLRMRDEGISPPLKSQVLIYPVLQALDLQTPSFQQNANGPMLIPAAVAYYGSMYIQGNTELLNLILTNQHRPHDIKKLPQLEYLDYDDLPKDYLQKPFQSRPPKDTKYDLKVWDELKDLLLNPYLAPLMANDLRNLPDACVLTCQLDVLRDEGTWYAQRLKKAGNQVAHINRIVGFHGLFQLNGPFGVKEGEDFLQEIVECMRKII